MVEFLAKRVVTCVCVCVCVCVDTYICAYVCAHCVDNTGNDKFISDCVCHTCVCMRERAERQTPDSDRPWDECR